MNDKVGAIKACGYRIVVQPEDDEKKTEGGIIIPSKERAEQEIGKLVAVGDLAWSDHGDGTPWAKVGDRVLYSKYGGKIIDDPGSGIRYRILNDEDVYCVIESDSEIGQSDYHGDTSSWELSAA